MTLVRKITWRDQNVHGRAVMMGGVVSDARFDIEPCAWCGTAAIPSWEHLAWFCKGFEQSRCAVPSDRLQFVLGWPIGSGRCYDAAVLAHLSGVRPAILDRRYRASGA